MKLFETEAKQLLEEYGLVTPGFEADEYVVKAQVLAKNRKENDGIKFASSRKEAEALASKIKARKVNGHEVNDVLIEEKTEFSQEYYIGVLYDTDVRSPVLLFSENGGTGVEDTKVQKLVLEDYNQWRIREFLKNQDISSDQLVNLGKTIGKICECFFEQDARMIEINPLVKTDSGYVVLDAMVDLEEDASYRHSRDYEERSEFGRQKTEREIKAAEIDRDDHQGIAGKYTELDGDIAMMLAGGGASLSNMDALIE